MADDTGLPHEIPFLEAADPPSIHGITTAMAAQIAERLGDCEYAEVLTSQTTASTTATDLATVGPSVTVDVPANWLVAVRAASALGSSTGTAHVYLVEDGVSLSQILSFTGAVPAGYATVPGSTTGTAVAALGGWLLFSPSAGSHTYKLQYDTTSGTGTFSGRRLWVRVIPF